MDYETWKVDQEHFSVLMKRMTSRARYKPDDKPAPKLTKKTSGDGMMSVGEVFKKMIEQKETEGDSHD